MEDMLAEKDLAWPRFSGNEMRDLVSYVQEATESSREEKRRMGIVPSKAKVLFLSENRFNGELARQGKKIYTAKACHACHDIGGEKKEMGGNLKNITKIRDLKWLFNFIKDPKSMLKTDGLAKQLLKEFNNIPMPQQGLTDEEVIAIIEYLKAPEKIK
jgi:cytochrome c1